MLPAGFGILGGAVDTPFPHNYSLVVLPGCDLSARNLVFLISFLSLNQSNICPMEYNLRVEQKPKNKGKILTFLSRKELK